MFLGVPIQGDLKINLTLSNWKKVTGGGPVAKRRWARLKNMTAPTPTGLP